MTASLSGDCKLIRPAIPYDGGRRDVYPGVSPEEGFLAFDQRPP
jgi:hypothetical protein